MTKGSFTDFLDALRAFESGVDAGRFQTGQITEGQIRGWVGDAAFDAYLAGGIAWRDMQYLSENSLGFVGYQFGEPLLIDLGYYADTAFYGAGESTNLWDGTFTGKGGIDSLAELKTALQEGVILDAFGFNLKVIEEGLAASGRRLADFIGETASYVDAAGASVPVELSLTGILAAAHLRGAWGTLDLLQRGAVSSDEYGTSILKYIADFGGYDAVGAETLIAAHRAGTTSDLAEHLWQADFDGDDTVAAYAGVTPDDPSDQDPVGPVDPSPVDPGTPEDPDPVGGRLSIEWSWGSHRTIAFDPATDTLDFGWFQAGQFTISETGGQVVIAIPANNQSYTLAGVSLADLSLADIAARDASALASWQAALGGTPGEEPADPGEPEEPHHPHDPEEPEHPHEPGGGRVFAIVTNGADIADFDPAADRFDFGVHSVHNFIMVDTAEGVGFRSPWNGDILVVRSVSLAELGTGNFAAIGNQHLREDVSGALAWEHGVAAAPNTVYARSHEVGQVDRVAFEPATDIVDFRYFGTRELISMRQEGADVVISSDATGQQLVLLGTQLGELSGRNFVFHASQVREDHLDTQLGIVHDPANVRDRADIPTAGGDAGVGGDCCGDPACDGHHDHDDHGGGHDHGGEPEDDGYGDGGHDHGGGGQTGGTPETIVVGWAWGTHAQIDFDPAADTLDFVWMGADSFRVSDTDAGILIEILDNNQSYTLAGLDFDDLSGDDILARDGGTAAFWTSLLADADPFFG